MPPGFTAFLATPGLQNTVARSPRPAVWRWKQPRKSCGYYFRRFTGTSICGTSTRSCGMSAISGKLHLGAAGLQGGRADGEARKRGPHRPRRSRMGRLLHIEGSKHCWLENEQWQWPELHFDFEGLFRALYSQPFLCGREGELTRG